MTQTREGGCQCGSVRYAIDGDPIGLGVCHCTECQRQSGSAFGMSLVMPGTSFRVLQGELRMYARPADSGRTVECFFCPQCGTRIYHKAQVIPGAVNVKPGTLDDTSWLSPNLQSWTRSKQPWVSLSIEVPCFEADPKRR